MVGTAPAAAAPVPELSREDEIKAYREMLLIRRFEEKAGQLYGMGFIGGFCHLYIGQEAVVVGLQMCSKEGDQVITTYRDHGHMLATGMEARGVMAELTGRRSGYSHGKGGSMHMFSKEKNFYGGHGIVGASVPLGAGLAFANKYRGNDNVCWCYFGDGAANQGQVYEAFNMSELWKLPVIFVMENNGYNVVTTSAQEDANAAAGEPLATKAKAYSMPGVTVDGTDPLAVHQAVGDAVERARAGRGPTLIESKVYRLSAHGNIIAPPGVPLHYPEHEAIAVFGKREEYEAALRGDPVPRFRGALINAGTLSPERANEIAQQVAAEMQTAVDFALKSPFPKLKSALDYNFA